MTGNIFEILYNMFFWLIRIGSEIWDFLFSEITYFNALLGMETTIIPFYLIVFGGFGVFITLYLVKTFVPLA